MAMMAPNMPMPMMGQAPSAPTPGELSPKIIDQLKKSKDAKSLVAWIRTNYTRTKSARSPYERQWFVNYAFYKGRQNVTYLPNTIPTLAGGGKLYTPPAPPYRVRSVTNRIKPIIRTEMSRLTANKPSASVVPASSEDKDLYAAQAAEQIWESIYNQKDIHSTFTRAMFWMSICGTSFIKDWWDSDCVDFSRKYQGDIKYGVVTPFHLFVPDLQEEGIEEQPYLLNVYTKGMGWVKSHYPTLDFNPSIVSANEIMGEGFFRTQTGYNSRPDSVLVIEAWIKPGGHKLFPKGGFCTIVDDTLVGLFADGMPYDHGDYPFTKFNHIMTGEFYGDSVIVDLINPQREYNRTRSQIIESKNRMAKPQLIAPINSIDPAKITTQPGQVILYRPGIGKPEPLPMQPLPSYVLQEQDRIISDMQDISSQHEISRGETPPGVTAATAISYLQERDDSPLSMTYQGIDHGWKKMAKHTLSHVIQFWDTPRTISTTGTDDSFEAIVLRGSDISTGTDVRIEAGSALPTSKAAKQAFLMDAMKMGFIDPQKGLSMMDMGGLDKIFDELKADERQASRENLRMRALQIEQIMEHMQQIATMKQQAQDMAQQQMMQQPMQQPGMPPQSSQMQDPQVQQQLNQDPNSQHPIDPASLPPGFPLPPPEIAGGQSPPDQMQPPPPPVAMGNVGAGTDPTTGAAIIPSTNIVQVNSWDNHPVHIEKHNSFRKSETFEMLSDQVKQQFEAHVQMHQQAIQSQAMQAMAAQSASPMPGGGPGNGGPPGPPPGGGMNQFGSPGTTGGGSIPPPPQGG